MLLERQSVNCDRECDVDLEVCGSHKQSRDNFGLLKVYRIPPAANSVCNSILYSCQQSDLTTHTAFEQYMHV